MMAIPEGSKLYVDLRSVRRLVPASPVGVNDGPSPAPAASVLHQPECKILEDEERFLWVI